MPFLSTIAPESLAHLSSSENTKGSVIETFRVDLLSVNSILGLVSLSCLPIWMRTIFKRRKLGGWFKVTYLQNSYAITGQL